MEVRTLGRARAWALVALAAGMGFLAASPSARGGDEATASRRSLASEAVREALQHEVYGLDEERNRLLAEAAKHDPKFDAARWHAGQVKDEHGKWVDHDQIQESAGLAERLKDYVRIRDKHPDTVEGQLAIAAWCAKRKLTEQQRAHLTRVLDLSPDHPEAREKLGFVRVDDNWIARDQIAAAQQKAAQAERDLRTWRPVLQEIFKDLRHRSETRRAEAKERLFAIHDPAALPALVEIVFSGKEDEAQLAIEVQAQIESPDAALALARAAVYSPVVTIREAAVAKLSEREPDEFVPELLASLYSPLMSRTAMAILPNGRMALRQVFAREGQDRQEVMTFDTQYQRRERIGGNRAETTARATVDAVNRAARTEMAAQQQNALTQAMNERIMWVLSKATKEQHADPAAWWQWWNDRNEVFQAGSKQVSFKSQAQTVNVVDYVPPPQQSRTTGTQSGTQTGGTGGGTQATGRVFVAVGRGNAVRYTVDCLAAGTPVWTVNGLTPIETVKVGDLVLAQNQETGELSYKPVLRTTIRPKSQLIRLKIDRDTVETSGGHLFWVSGEGWVRSRDLQAGMILHGVDGPSRVLSVEPSDEAETYNLVVADFNTYFVGESKVLSHDNTVRQPTASIVPGLRIE